MVDISVIICTHNGASRLPMTLDAVVAQQVPAGVGWEVLLVDNASTDNTAAVAMQYASRSSAPFRVLREAQPGKLHALRLGAREATGCLIAVVDDDNILDPNWIATAIAFFQSHPQAGLIGGRVQPLFEIKPPPEVLPHVGLYAITDHGDQDVCGIQPHGAGSVIRADLLRTIYFDIGTLLPGRVGKALGGGEDHEVATLVELLGWECWYTPSLELQHAIPAARLRIEYLQKILLDMAPTYPWLSLLSRMKAGKTSHIVWLLCQMAWQMKIFVRHVVRPAPKNGMLADNAQWRTFYLRQIQSEWRMLWRRRSIKGMQQRIGQFAVRHERVPITATRGMVR